MHLRGTSPPPHISSVTFRQMTSLSGPPCFVYKREVATTHCSSSNSLKICNFFNGHTHSTWKFPEHGPNQSCSYNLCCSCSNATTLTYCARYLTCTSTATQATESMSKDSPRHVESLTHCAPAGTPKDL